MSDAFTSQFSMGGYLKLHHKNRHKIEFMEQRYVLIHTQSDLIDGTLIMK